ncbi:unnamed protein product [Trifolium pratense]|uniref:Uncharacterized protein n=1 Tax=Trifolium pratense TaxID=57577 RepID=A0ACB0LBY0_TRIPR|nr:unnamed protein product [Trifolium pratense]
MGSKWEIEKFTGKNDFGLWKVKVRAILTQQKCVEALLGISNMPNTLSNAEKSEMNDKALSVIILCLADNVLREVAKEKTAAAMWTKLDALYMTKSLAHKQCLKERLFFFRMVENKPVVEQLSEFNKIIDDLANIDVNLEDEDKAFHLLCALPKSLENLKDALLYGKEGISFLNIPGIPSIPGIHIPIIPRISIPTISGIPTISSAPSIPGWPWTPSPPSTPKTLNPAYESPNLAKISPSLPLE